MRMQSKVCLVTGGTCGIGAAIAEAFLREGAHVSIAGLEGSLSWDTTQYGERVQVIYGDLGHADTPHDLVRSVVGRFGEINVLVNNAATMERADISSTDAAVFDRIMAINVRGPLLLCKETLPYLIGSNGCVLNIGSTNGYCGEGQLLPYSISKGALLTLSRNLADDWAVKRVRVNHFVVGWVLTPNEHDRKVRDGLSNDWHLRVSRTDAPSGALITPQTIAEAAVFWCSDESSPLSGNVIEMEQFPAVGRNPKKSG